MLANVTSRKIASKLNLGQLKGFLWVDIENEGETIFCCCQVQM